MRAKRRAPGVTLLTVLFLAVTAIGGAEEVLILDLSAEDRAALTALLGEQGRRRSSHREAHGMVPPR